MNDEPAPICPRCGGRDVDTHPTVYYVIWCDRCGALEYDSDTGEVVEPVISDREPCSYCGGTLLVNSADPTDCPHCDDGYSRLADNEIVEPVSELRRRLDLDNRRYYYQETFDARAFKAPGPWACVES